MALTPERKAQIDGLPETKLREEHNLGSQYSHYQGESYKYIGVRLALIDQAKAAAALVKTEATGKTSIRLGWWALWVGLLSIVVAIAIYYLQR